MIIRWRRHDHDALFPCPDAQDTGGLSGHLGKIYKIGIGGKAVVFDDFKVSHVLQQVQQQLACACDLASIFRVGIGQWSCQPCANCLGIRDDPRNRLSENRRQILPDQPATLDRNGIGHGRHPARSSLVRQQQQFEARRLEARLDLGHERDTPGPR
ncbi:hypothetical protein ACFSLT_14640 [Novosphingobium resinovorum]